MTKTEIKVRIKEINTELDQLLQADRQIKAKRYDQWITDLLLDMSENGVANWPWAKLIDSVSKKSLLKEKLRLQQMLQPEPLPDGTIGTREVELAKQVPMDQLIEFNRYKAALCLWHKDTHPSMTWFKKNNKVKCFACGQTGDTIDVAMKLYNLNLPQAVKRLLNV